MPVLVHDVFHKFHLSFVNESFHSVQFSVMRINHTRLLSEYPVTDKSVAIDDCLSVCGPRPAVYFVVDSLTHCNTCRPFILH